MHIQSIFDWGLSVILAIQTVRTPLLDHLFIAISGIGSEYFYFAALPLICTMINRTVGIRIALTILVSVMINSLIKEWVAEPRPFFLDPSVAVVPETGFGFPSGHTQQAALFWGLAILYVRQWWIAILGALFVGLVGLSRIYLGAHYPTDVLGSLCIAALILYSYQLLVRYGDKIWHPTRRTAIFAIILLAAIVASLAAPTKDMLSAAGLGVGLVAGILFTDDLPPLSSSLKTRFLTAAVTAIVLGSVYGGLKFVFPPKGNNYYEIFSFVRYFLCGFTLNAFPLFVANLAKSTVSQSATEPSPKRD